MAKQLKRIIYVEDEPDIRAIAQIALEDIGGFELDVCTCGAEAIENGPRYDPDLILLDVMMPNMDGPETYRHLRAMPALSDTPVIFMTAKVQTHEVDSYKELGAAAVIPKPFDPMSLASEIQTIWDKIQSDGAV